MASANASNSSSVKKSLSFCFAFTGSIKISGDLVSLTTWKFAALTPLYLNPIPTNSFCILLSKLLDFLLVFIYV